MSSFSFTGKGMRYGRLLPRNQWVAEAEARGWTYHEKPQPYTDYLVASRSDTIKAATAKRNGTTVISYAQFEALLGSGIVQVRPTHNEPRPNPAAMKAAIEQAAQSIEGWGSF